MTNDEMFEMAQDIEGCPKCVEEAAERERKIGGYTWYGALRGWGKGCRPCFERIQAFQNALVVEKT